MPLVVRNGTAPMPARAGLTGDMRNGSIRMRSRTSLHRTLAAQRKVRNPSLRNEVRNVEKSPEAIFPQGTTLAQPSGLLGKRCNIAISNFFLPDNIELFYSTAIVYGIDAARTQRTHQCCIELVNLSSALRDFEYDRLAVLASFLKEKSPQANFPHASNLWISNFSLRSQGSMQTCPTAHPYGSIPHIACKNSQ